MWRLASSWAEKAVGLIEWRRTTQNALASWNPPRFRIGFAHRRTATAAQTRAAPAVHWMQVEPSHTLRFISNGKERTLSLAGWVTGILQRASWLPERIHRQRDTVICLRMPFALRDFKLNRQYAIAKDSGWRVILIGYDRGQRLGRGTGCRQWNGEEQRSNSVNSARVRHGLFNQFDFFDCSPRYLRSILYEQRCEHGGNCNP